MNRQTEDGRFGPFGGRYVPETLIAALDELGTAFDEASQDVSFSEQLEVLRRDYVGPPFAPLPGREAGNGLRCGSDLPQTGRSQPYRRP